MLDAKDVLQYKLHPSDLKESLFSQILSLHRQGIPPDEISQRVSLPVTQVESALRMPLLHLEEMGERPLL